MSDASTRHAVLGSPPSGVLAGGSGGLPRPLTSFIGRERELAQARRLLESSCLLTLTGPGGSGKTRLCIELAASLAGDYPDGVYFVRLARSGIPGWFFHRSPKASGCRTPRAAHWSNISPITCGIASF